MLNRGWECFKTYLKKGKKTRFKTENKKLFFFKLSKIRIVWESNRCDRGMSRLPLLSRLDRYNAAPDHIKHFVAKRRDDYLTPVFLAANPLDHRFEGRKLELNKR